MFLSDGFKDAMSYYGWRYANDFQIFFIEGTLPTKEEIEAEMSKFDQVYNTGPLTYYYRTSPAQLKNVFLPSRNEAMLACNNYVNIPKINGGKGSYKIDFTRSTGKTAFLAAGTMGYAVLAPWENTSVQFHNYTQSLMFLSVGLIGSGADVELTSLEVEEGIDIRMNEIEINY